MLWFLFFCFFVDRLLAVLHKQHRQPTLLCIMQCQLPARFYKNTDLSLRAAAWIGPENGFAGRAGQQPHP